jgi:RNA polymerase sigma-70 factor (family 1)
MKIESGIVRNLQQRLETGEQRAFEELYRLFFPRLFKFAMMHVHRKELSEEIVNDVMVKIWNRREHVMEIENFETYLFVAVRNLSLNYLSKFSHVHVTASEATGLSELINLNTPGKDLEWKEIAHKLSIAIDQMPAQCKTVFKLIKEDGFRYKQVAEILGISSRTVETQLFRAIKKLSAVVNEYVDKPPVRKPAAGKDKLISIIVIFFLTVL